MIIIQNLLLSIVLLIVGFVALIKGADIFVEGSAAVAKRFKIPEAIIGLTIVAMGTSAPELAVSISAGLSGSNEIAISNVIGSNLFNLLVVLGACALMHPVSVEKGIMKRDFPFSIIITALIAVFINDFIFNKDKTVNANNVPISGDISRWNAIVLLVLFIIYMIITVRAAITNRTEGEEIQSLSLGKSIIYIVLGAAAIVIGGQLVVNNAKNIALIFGMSETLVGLTICAIGTSLPELVTSVVASKKGQNEMAVGNVVGSNIFNLLLILGVSCTIHPISVSTEAVIDIVILLIASILVFVFAKSGKSLNRKEGIILLLVYVAYTTYAIIR